MEPAQNNDALTNQPPKEVPDSEPVSTVMPDGVTSPATESAANPSIVNITDSTAVETDTPSTIPSATVANSVAQPVVGSTVAAAEPSLSSIGLSTMPPAQPVANATATAPPVNDSSTAPDDSSQIPVTSGPVISGGLRKSRKKFFLFGGVALLLVLLLAGGWVFGMYLPNKPENVWKTGLDRTGQALDKVIGDTTSTQNVNKLKTSELTGDFSYKAKDSGTITGHLSTRLDDANSDSGVTVTFKPDDQLATKLSAKILTTKLDKDALYPDIYFQLTGFKDLGLDAMMPGVSKYDGQWIALPADYLSEQFDATTDSSKSADKSLTTAEVTEAIKAVTATTREYVFTSDSAKAVVVNKGFKQKETVDGVATYRYTAGFNKAHGDRYCTALGDTIVGTKAFKKLVAEDERADQKKSFVDDCKDGFKNIKDSDTFDLWVDAHYKLIYKVRVHDEENGKNYIDIGQHYTGGDDVKLFMKIHDEDEPGDASAEMTLNFKDYTLKGSAEVKVSDPASPFTLKVNVSGNASDNKVNVTKPAGTVDIKDVLKSLGLDPAPNVAPSPSSNECSDNPLAGACVSQDDGFRVNFRVN